MCFSASSLVSPSELDTEPEPAENGRVLRGSFSILHHLNFFFEEAPCLKLHLIFSYFASGV